MRGASAGDRTPVPLTRRLREEDFTSNLCWLFVCSRTSFPVPVTRTRFAVPLWVFIFGMVPRPVVCVGAHASARRLSDAHRPSRWCGAAGGQAVGACSGAALASDAVAFSAFALRRAASV